jgi:hypothetical protein
MRIEHSKTASFIQGKPSEQEKILRWIELAGAEIMVDECEEGETSYTVIIPYSTQKERSEAFSKAKKTL